VTEPALLMIVVMAVLSMLLGVFRRDGYSVVLFGIAMGMFLVGAAGSTEVDYPRTLIYDNTADNSYTIIHDVQTHDNGELGLACIGLAVVSAGMLFVRSAELLAEVAT